MRARTMAALAAALLGTTLGSAGGESSRSVTLPVEPPAGERFLPVGTDRCGTGALQVLSVDGPEVREFPLEHTRVDARITGPVSRVEVTQVFGNPFEETIEAVYVFPLPHEAAVTDLEMRLGERVIVGKIDRREIARKIYEDAKRGGRTAALLEEERANIFTQSVANILPGSEIEITIGYVERLDSEGGTWEFAFPMVVGPRYVPPGSAPDDVVTASFRPVPPSVPDADRINPEFLPPSVRSGHDIELSLTLDAGVPISDLRSPTHAFETGKGEGGTRIVRLHPLDTIPNKDFVLRWNVDAKEPRPAVLAHHDGASGYVSVVFHPKSGELRTSEITPKEMVFVLDCSGSMRGEPMAAAKALARRAIRTMDPRDSFQIIRFSTDASGFSPRPVEATPENVRRGLGYLESLSGSGGTQMIEGIRAALDYPADPNRLRIVMFLTDGYIGNENEILAAVRDRIGSARLFSFGVGSSVNRLLLDEMAREGRGEVEYLLAGSDRDAIVEKFSRRVQSPYLTDIELEWSGVGVEDVYPARVPDLFAGKPLVVRARYDEGGRGELRIRGRLAGRPWEKRIRLDLPEREAGNSAIGSLWARARIADLERSMRHGPNDAVVEEITSLGLSHRLVTPWTSFVAVEERLVVSDGNPRTVRVPVDLPEGVSWEGVFGEERGRPNPAPMQRLGHAKGASPSRQPSSAELPAELKVFRVEADRMDRMRKEGSSSIRTIDTKEQTRIRAIESVDEDEGLVASALAIRLEVVGEELSLDGRVTLRITFTNRGAEAIDVPAEGELTAEVLGLRVVDSRWNETRIGVAKRRVRTGKLAPGASVTREVTIPVARLGRPAVPGVVHLFLEGARWGAADSPRVTVRIAGG